MGRQKPNIAKSLNVTFRSIEFTVSVDEDSTVSDMKNKIKHFAAKLIENTNAKDIYNEHMRLIDKDSCTRMDTDKMEMYFHGKITELEVVVEEAFGLTFRKQSSQRQFGLFVFPSDSMYNVYHKIYQRMVGAKEAGKEDYKFSIHCERREDKPLDFYKKKLDNYLMAGDKLVIKYKPKKLHELNAEK